MPRLLSSPASPASRAASTVEVAPCAPGGAPIQEALDQAAAEQLARTVRALADPARLRLLSLVAAHPAGEACVCDLTAPIGLAQATVSFHLKTLVDAGLLVREQRGRWSFYRCVDGALDALAETLRQI